MKIYLAGPIEGCSFDEIKVWRDYVKHHLFDYDCIEPRDNLIDSKEIFNSNKEDVQNADITFAFLPKNINYKRASYGTIFEISYAYSIGKKVIIVSDDEYVHNHPVMKEIGTHFLTLDTAIDCLKKNDFNRSIHIG